MLNILVLNSIVPYPANYSGNSIRVFPLSCELAKHHNCFLAAFGVHDDRYEAILKTGIYKDTLLLPGRSGGGSIFRHIFPLTGHMARRSHPAYYREIVSSIRQFIRKNNIELLLVHTVQASQFTQAIREIPVILDQIDCRTLSLRRRLEHLGSDSKWRDRRKLHRAIRRAEYEEGNFSKYFCYVTTVSRVDRQVLQEIAQCGKDRILDIPNGFSTELLEYRIPDKQLKNAIAFWGALDFPPNNTAVEFFYDQVFVPYLSDKDINWYIIGRNASPKMLDMAERHENIILTGFVDDLYELVSTIPVMINPMQMGGGLKNKVLEAFALERIVVSNSMGVEAIDAVDGLHYCKAETPQQFSNTILHYLNAPGEQARIGRAAREFVMESFTWEKIGNRFLRLIDEALAAHQQRQ